MRKVAITLLLFFGQPSLAQADLQDLQKIVAIQQAQISGLMKVGELKQASFANVAITVGGSDYKSTGAHVVLSAGDWDLTGTVLVEEGSSSYVTCIISKTDASNVGALDGAGCTIGAVINGVGGAFIPRLPVKVPDGATTTYYLNTSVSAPSRAWGSITARRIR